jgi:hypothetical protein
MKLTCKNCGAPIAVKNINLQTMIAACESCNAVFPFTAEDVRAPESPNVKLKTPEGFDIQSEDSNSLDIRFEWRKMLGSLEWMVIGLMGAGAVVLTAMSLLVWNEVLTDPQGPLGPVIVGSLFSAIALICWYVLAVFAFNRTRLTLTDETLDYTHAPLYWMGIHIPTDSITRVELTPTDQFEDYRSLIVVTQDGRRHRLDHFQIHHAQYLQRKLQRALFRPAPQAHDRLAEPLDEGEEVRIGDDGELEVVRARSSG